MLTPEQIKASHDSLFEPLISRGGSGLQRLEAALLKIIAENAGSSSSSSGAVTAYSTASTSTAVSGAAFVALSAGAATEIVVKNTTGVTLEIQPVAGGAIFTVVDKEDISLPVLANSSEWRIRRQDLSSTIVSVNFLRLTR